MLGILGITDWVDGWVARKFGQATAFGAVFDPVVDRILFLVAAIAVLAEGAVPSWFLVAIVAREVFVGLLMIVGQLLGMVRFPPTTLGKRYTFLLMMAVPLLLLGASSHPTASVAIPLGWVLGIPGLVLSGFTAVDYVPRVVRAVRAGRAERRVR